MDTLSIAQLAAAIEYCWGEFRPGTFITLEHLAEGVAYGRTAPSTAAREAAADIHPHMRGAEEDELRLVAQRANYLRSMDLPGDYSQVAR